MPTRLLLFLSFVFVLALCFVEVLAEDGAHGGADSTATNTEAHEPGAAVKAPRTTERYTEQGLTIDPVAIDVAPNGDIYVAEGSRAGGSVIDNRNKGLRDSNGVINDLQKTSVEDRLKQINMLTEGGFYPEDTFTKSSDRVRLVKDTDGDGKADLSSIFADNFNDPLDGIASGVLFHDGKVYLTNIPHLWLLEDKDGDGDADKETEGERTSLSYGYGIRWAFYGHDMHGLIKGPDGRIYFSIGDRGYNVTTQEGKQLYGPDRGAVFRMWPDGSGLEVFFEGLRNPQELAFDNYGNLFTGDNNSDSGDKARFAYLPEGGDAGWRQDVQSLKDRGPWNREFMWHPRKPKDDISQPAWIIPPLKNVGRGPSGLTHYPGTGDVFPSNGSFLMCDYPAGVRHVYVEPNGATFKVVEDSQLPVEGSTITDVTWGYDGRLYLSDWGGGWKPNPNGYIKTMKNAKAHEEQAKVIAEVKSLFAEGLEKLSDEKLVELLGHADQRVRIHAQWEIAGRKGDGTKLSLVISDTKSSVLSKIHAVWAVAMRCRAWGAAGHDLANYALVQGLDDPNPSVRAQVIHALGDLRYPLDAVDLLQDSSPNVQYHAAIAVGKTGGKDDIGPLLDLLDRNNNDDVAIRHAASYGLSLIGDANAIASEAKQKGAGARLGGVLALRRLDSLLLADFLNDEDPMVAAEAARAIYDKRVADAMPALAALSESLPVDRMSEPVMRRVIEANVRIADLDSAMRLGKLAANADAPEMWRLQALTELDNWASDRNREGVWGAWWPRPVQTMEHAKTSMLTYLPAIAGKANETVGTQVRTLMQKHIKKSSPAELAQATLNSDEPEALRRSTLLMLAEADKPLAIQTAKQLADSRDSTAALRIQARLTLIGLDMPAGQQAYAQAIGSGELIEQQDAIERLGAGPANSEIAGEVFSQLTDALKRGELDPALKLDVVQAVSSNQAMPAPVRLAVQQYVEQNQSPGEAPFIRDASLAGGSAERGLDLFLNHESAQCQRCHAADGSDTVGPGLYGIGNVKDANYLYDALVRPSAAIANGFASTTVRLKDGQTRNGRILADRSTETMLVLTNADGDITEVPRDQVEGMPIISDQSLMPTMTDKLSPTELRDVLAYLGSLQSEPSPAYRAGSGAMASSGPSVYSMAKDMKHVIWLPGILLGITAALFVLLMMTILGGQMAKP